MNKGKVSIKLVESICTMKFVWFKLALVSSIKHKRVHKISSDPCQRKC